MEYLEFKAEITPLEVGRDILIAELAEIGFESFVETEIGVEAYIQKDDFKEDLISTMGIISNTDFTITYVTKLIADQNWNAEWEKNFDLINVENKCIIRAPFHNKIDSVEFDVVIDPKMSFGTGHHETTYLMIKRLLTLDLTHKKVLDMGCGTGVLAILAKMKNADRVEAIDIDEWAYNNTIENIRNNNCEDIIVKMGGAERIDDEFNVIIANINRNILLKNMAVYVKALQKNGILLLSGFFSSDKEVLLEATSQLNLELIYTESKNDWTILHLIKK
ncbi:MAG: 50S ribosomal protein L11 methyltransferase [Vicingaceae bacterium]|jgi:ribosomal protein L11 methyltransferase